MESRFFLFQGRIILGKFERFGTILFYDHADPKVCTFKEKIQRIAKQFIIEMLLLLKFFIMDFIMPVTVDANLMANSIKKYYNYCLHSIHGNAYFTTTKHIAIIPNLMTTFDLFKTLFV